MEVKIVKVREDVKDPVINTDGSISVFANKVEQAFDATRKQVLVYFTGVNVEIPEGWNLIATSPRGNVIRSVSFEKDMILTNENNSSLENVKELTVEYKVTTDVMPATYTVGEEIVRLYPIRKEEVSLSIDTQIQTAEVISETTMDITPDMLPQDGEAEVMPEPKTEA